MACVQYRSALCRRQEPIANRTPTQIFLNQPFGFTRRHRWPSRPPLRPTPGPRHCRLPPPTCSPALGPVSPPSRCAAAGRARGGHRLTRVRRRAARAASAVEVARRASTRAALLVRSSRRTDPSSSCEGTHSDAGASAHAYWGRRGSGRVERRRDGAGDGNLDPRGGFVLPHYPAFSCPRRDRVSDVPGVKWAVKVVRCKTKCLHTPLPQQPLRKGSALPEGRWKTESRGEVHVQSSAESPSVRGHSIDLRVPGFART